jgi:hypothetical protein
LTAAAIRLRIEVAEALVASQLFRPNNPLIEAIRRMA